MKNKELKKAGLKTTQPRVQILNVLENSEQRHLSAEDVFKILLSSDMEVGLATVYRVLTQFEAAGMVTRHNFEEGHSVFELASESHHDHIVCTQCGKVIEFMDETIEVSQEKVARENGFSIKDHSMTIYGNCLDADCEGKKDL